MSIVSATFSVCSLFYVVLLVIRVISVLRLNVHSLYPVCVTKSSKMKIEENTPGDGIPSDLCKLRIRRGAGKATMEKETGEVEKTHPQIEGAELCFPRTRQLRSFTKGFRRGKVGTRG